MSDIKTFESNGIVADFIFNEKAETYKSVAEWAAFYGIARQTAQRHIDNAIEEGEIDPATSCSLKLLSVSESASGHFRIYEYNGDVGIAIGYRARKSKVASAFRIWLAGVAKQLLTKGIAVNEAVLNKRDDKQAIIDDLLHKVACTEKDINHMLSLVIREEDQQKYPDAMKKVYARVTNMARIAATEMTAAQIKLDRCCHTKQNLGMVSAEGDPQTARNYLTPVELEKTSIVEQQFVLILRSRLFERKQMGLVELLDLIEHAVGDMMQFPLEAKSKEGTQEEATKHVKEQKRLARLLLSE